MMSHKKINVFYYIVFEIYFYQDIALSLMNLQAIKRDVNSVSQIEEIKSFDSYLFDNYWQNFLNSLTNSIV
jgi:hypothetical protein